MINMQDYWFSPSYVIYMAEKLIKIYGQKIIDKDTHHFRHVGEMKCAAIMLFALHRALGQNFLMRASQEEFPDVYTLYQEEVPGKLVDTKYQTVEVVTYDPHSEGDVVDFILKTKLMNPKKSYDEDTIILCYIRKAGTYIDFNYLYEKLKKNKFKPSRVFIIGNKVGYENIFVLSQVWPTIHHEAVDYIERAKTYPLPHRRLFKKGVSKKINDEFSSSVLTTNPYEVFHIDETKVKEKYKNETF